MNRHELREQLFLLLFQHDFYTEDETKAQAEDFFACGGFVPDADDLMDEIPEDEEASRMAGIPGLGVIMRSDLADSAGKRTMSDDEVAEVRAKYENILKRLQDIDDEINLKTTGWDTTRMGKVDLTILRLAIYEILYDDNVPEGVAINEAVELGKAYGQDNTPSFINGVLARFAK